jgi:predicted porin
MKRTLIVAAIGTLLAGTAAAQSNVTIYGRLNTSIERQKNYTSADNVWVLQNNASRLGFRGTEDLGGGLKAGFVLEHRFNVDNGNTTFGNGFWGGAGTSEVFVGGNFGTLRLGHFTSEAYFATSDYTDLLNHGTGTSSDALYRYLGNDNNKIAYRAPAFGPVTVEGAVSLGEGPTGSRIIDFAANYAAGPLALGFGFEDANGGAADGSRQFAVRGAYEFGSALVTGYVQRYKDGPSGDSQTIFRVSGMYTMGLTELHAAFGSSGELGNSNTGEAKQYTVGANYNLSKRTKVFAFYNRNKPDGAEAQTAMSVGVRHNF